MLTVSVFVPASAVSADTASGITEANFKEPPTDDNSADVKAFKNTVNALDAPVIVDFSTKTTFGQTAKLTAISPIEQAGKYSFVNVDGVDCMKLNYEPTYSTASISPYRIMFVFHNKSILTETAELTPSMVKRFANDGASHCSVCFGGDKEGGEYSIKAIYFFPSKSQAERFGN